MSGSTLAAAWYDQGLRVIDASNARDLRQVGYYYVNGTDAATNPSSLSWDTAWRGDLVYLFDMDRGIEILRLKGGPGAAARLATVREPRARADRLAKAPVAGSGLTPGSLVCPLFAPVVRTRRARRRRAAGAGGRAGGAAQGHRQLQRDPDRPQLVEEALVDGPSQVLDPARASRPRP